MAAKSYSLIAFTMCWLFAEASDAADTAYDLFLACSGQRGLNAANFCLGYVSGAFAFMGPDDGVCRPSNMLQQGVLQQVFINWASRHPEQLYLARSTSVHLAFTEAYPCSAPGPQPRPR